MEIKKLLESRTKRNKKKPTFVVKESKFTSGVKKRWRYPRGKHSAVRQGHRGRPAMPSPGYGIDKRVKGLHVSGLETVVVKNKSELLALDEKKQGAMISKTLGSKKRVELLKLAQEKKIAVLNVKDATKLLEKITKKFEARLKKKKDKLSEKSKKKEAKKKKAEEKEKKEKEEQEKTVNKESSVEDKINKEEEKEKEFAKKVMTKRQ